MDSPTSSPNSSSQPGMSATGSTPTSPNVGFRPDVPPPPPPTSAPNTSSQPVTSPPPPLSPSSPSPVGNPPSSAQSTPASSGFNKKPIIIVGLLIILLLIGFFAFRFLRGATGNKQVTLTYWGLWETEEYMRPVLTEFEAAHPNIKVDYKQQSATEYRERLQSALSQNKGPDVFRIHNTWVPMFRNSLAAVPESVYSTTQFQTTFYPTASQDLKLGNSIYAVPLEFDGLAMYVNNDLMAAAGQSVPETWDDLRNVAIAASKCSTVDSVCRPGAQIVTSGAALGTTDNVDHWQDIVAILMMQNNVNLDRPNSPSPEPAEDVINYYRSFHETYNVWEPALPTSTNQFINGKLAIYFAPSWRVFEIKSSNPNLNFSIYPVPQVPVEADRQEQPITWATYWVESVNKKSPNADESWELIKFLSSSEIQKKLYGQAVLMQRQFGEPYSRTDLATEISNEPYVGVFIEQANLAKSWYLASYTSDGPTGINSRISAAFARTINRSLSVAGLAGEVNSILSEYGVSVPNPAGQ